MSGELERLRRLAVPGNCAEFPAESLIVVFSEVERLTTELAERTRERDDAQTAICERAAHGRPGHESDHDFDAPADAARHFGWPHLYPEEPQP